MEKIMRQGLDRPGAKWIVISVLLERISNEVCEERKIKIYDWTHNSGSFRKSVFALSKVRNRSWHCSSHRNNITFQFECITFALGLFSAYNCRI